MSKIILVPDDFSEFSLPAQGTIILAIDVDNITKMMFSDGNIVPIGGIYNVSDISVGLETFSLTSPGPITPPSPTFQTWGIRGVLVGTQIAGAAGAIGDTYSIPLAYTIQTVVSGPAGSIQMLGLNEPLQTPIITGSAGFGLNVAQFLATGIPVIDGETDKIVSWAFSYVITPVMF